MTSSSEFQAHDVPSTLADVLAWARDTDASYDAIRELEKIPARLGLCDGDLGLLPADLGHFEEVVVPSSYGVVSRARDLKAARQRGNARVRALLRRFHAMQAGQIDASVRAAWDGLIAFVRAREGFVDRGALITTGTSRSLAMLRARARVSPRKLAATELERISQDLSSDKRKTLRRSITLLNRLVGEFGGHEKIADLLPPSPLPVPRSGAIVRRIIWSSLPPAFRADAEDVMRRALVRPEDRVAIARARIDAGDDARSVLRDLDVDAAKWTRVPANAATAYAGWRGAITWLIRARENLGQPSDTLSRLSDLITGNLLDHACQQHIERSAESRHLKDAGKSQTLAQRLTALETLARRGLQREDIADEVALRRRLFPDATRRRGSLMTDEARRLCDALIRSPSLAAGFVNAPRNIATLAQERISEARHSENPAAELSALRLYATAVLFGIQVSRPLRTSNLIRLRHRGLPNQPGHVFWVARRTHAELRFASGEVKNGVEVSVHLKGAEAEILWHWLTDLRSRYMALHGLEDTPYVLPGRAAPRLQSDTDALPPGCVAPSTLAEMWRDGAERIGLDLTPHQARHAVATLILAVEPGNFSKAASVLGDTENTVRRHYGRDTGAQAAQAVREALQTRHPGIFHSMRRRTTS
ncbi:hypothetical protein ATO8_18100 [Roseivivax marinus]|uniref:Uncharacterized protein n=1 Tax=Roseivivax marinus TaxID=1379903 RepID=W4HEP1_9RHOB|nr:hypothetical protein [Roseivivax marinus]ETW11242.1 hypothetical protein ATO8_18100 [Roseivivax marinus]